MASTTHSLQQFFRRYLNQAATFSSASGFSSCSAGACATVPDADSRAEPSFARLRGAASALAWFG